MHEAAWDWLLTCPHVGELFFGFATAREGGTLLVPVTACMDSAETEFVDGSSIRNYDLTIVRFCLYTAAPDDRENLDALDDLAKLADWVAAQSGQLPRPARGLHAAERGSTARRRFFQRLGRGRREIHAADPHPL